MYGFHKVVGLADGSLKTSEQRSKPPSEYENEYFKRGMPDLMWLIQKPNNSNKRKKGKKAKVEDTDDEEMSDKEDVEHVGQNNHGGQNLLEAPGTISTHQQHGAPAKVDLTNISSQLDALRNHQALISLAINKLKKDHNQLYEQSLAFQALHDRHEATINAILNFLHNVYDKGLGGTIGGALANLFATTAVSEALPRTPDGLSGPGGMRSMSGTPRMGLKRRPLLLENGPVSNSNGNNNNNNTRPSVSHTGSPQISYASSYRSPTTETFIQDEDATELPTSPTLRTDTLNDTHGFYSSHPSPSALTPRPPLNRSITPMSVSNAGAQNIVNGGKTFLEQHRQQLLQKQDEINQLESLQGQQERSISNFLRYITESNASNAGSQNGTPTTSPILQKLNSGMVQGSGILPGSPLSEMHPPPAPITTPVNTPTSTTAATTSSSAASSNPTTTSTAPSSLPDLLPSTASVAHDATTGFTPDPNLDFGSFIDDNMLDSHQFGADLFSNDFTNDFMDNLALDGAGGLGGIGADLGLGDGGGDIPAANGGGMVQEEENGEDEMKENDAKRRRVA